jgi:hypothetical protein
MDENMREIANEIREEGREGGLSVYQDTEYKQGEKVRRLRVKDYFNQDPDLVKAIAEKATEAFGEDRVKIYHPRFAYFTEAQEGLAVSITLPNEAVRAMD